jgi:hypothetical protein
VFFSIGYYNKENYVGTWFSCLQGGKNQVTTQSSFFKKEESPWEEEN